MALEDAAGKREKYSAGYHKSDRLLSIVTAQLEFRRAPAAPSTVMPGIAQMEKGNPLPR